MYLYGKHGAGNNWKRQQARVFKPLYASGQTYTRIRSTLLELEPDKRH